LIQLLRRRFEEAQLKVEDHFAVGELPMEIDLIASFERGEVANVPPLFHYFRRHNVIEIKTEADPLKIGDLQKLQAYAWHYMEKEVVVLMALNIREEAMSKFIDALGRKRVTAALSEEDLLTAVKGKERLLKALLAQLEPEQLRNLVAEVGRGG